MSITPCYDCGRREIMCHSKCQEYAEYKNRRDLVKGERVREYELADYFKKHRRSRRV